jgi:hypothetical protein
MRSILLSLLCGLFIAHAAHSAERPLDFLGIKWGASKAEVQQSMSAMSGVEPQKTKDNNRLEFSGGTFAGEPVNHFGMDFVGDKLYRAAVALKPVGDRENQYRDLRQLLVNKYGPATIDRKSGRFPQSIWKFPASGFNKESINLTVTMFRDGNHGPATKIVYVCDSIKGAPTDAAESL